MKKVMALLLAVVMVFALAACGSSAPAATAAPATEAPAAEPAAEATTEAVTEQADAAEEDAGFEEIPIFEDEAAGFINVNAVYFQPVPMEGDQSIGIEGFNMHIEADVSAMENDLGYGVGDWIPYLTIDYKITNEDTGDVAAEGTFMHMAASDGPHYGANINLPDAGTYTIDFAIHSPAEEGYLIHSDAETGPCGLLDDVWGDGPLTVHFEGWDYIPQEW